MLYTRHTGTGLLPKDTDRECVDVATYLHMYILGLLKMISKDIF